MAINSAKLLMSRVCRVPGACRPAPSLFHYPGLTARPTHSRDDMPFASWVRDLEAATPAIRAEYLRLQEEGRPSDYHPEGSDHDAGLHSGGEWHWSSLIDRGEVRQSMWERCPDTTAALRSIPDLCMGDMPFAFAFFSTLRPQCRIAPHTAPSNLRVRVHLPLIVPEPEVPSRFEAIAGPTSTAAGAHAHALRSCAPLPPGMCDAYWRRAAPLAGGQVPHL